MKRNQPRRSQFQLPLEPLGDARALGRSMSSRRGPHGEHEGVGRAEVPRDFGGGVDAFDLAGEVL
jgi:hypothetical protein